MLDAAYAALFAELQSDDLASLSDEAAAAKLNTDTITRRKPGSYLARGGVLKVLGAEVFRQVWPALEEAAQADPVIATYLHQLDEIAGGGVDFGGESEQAALDAMVAGSLLPEPVADMLKAYGSETLTRAQAIAGWAMTVTAADVAHARGGNSGTQ